MQLRSAGIDLSAVIGAVCRYFEIDEKELRRTTKRLEIARARALVSHIATREFSISCSYVACHSEGGSFRRLTGRPRGLEMIRP